MVFYMTSLRRLLTLAFILYAALLINGCQQSNREEQKVSDAGVKHEYPEPDAGNLQAFVELARKDVMLLKATIIAQNLPLTEAEATEFWPIHREYEAELLKLNDRKLNLAYKFIPQQGQMTDEQARVLAKDVFNIEEQRTALKRKYFGKFQKAIPATKAARFFQIENQLNMVLDLRLAAALPLIK
jgi:hypothetical protein